MKTSNILLITAFVLFTASLLAFDLGLKNEYDKIQKVGVNNYLTNNRFKYYTEVKLKNFTELDVHASNAIEVSVEYGEKEAIWVQRHSKNMVSIVKKGSKLVIDVTKKGMEGDYRDGDLSVFVISPRIRSVICSGLNKLKDHRCTTKLSGFIQDSLRLNIGSGSTLVLSKNHLKTLEALVGSKQGDGVLRINSDNEIQGVRLDVQGKSWVEVLDPRIKQYNNTVSDSARITLLGSVLKTVKN